MHDRSLKSLKESINHPSAALAPRTGMASCSVVSSWASNKTNLVSLIGLSNNVSAVKSCTLRIRPSLLG